MWEVVRNLGDETLYKCSECHYQTTYKGQPPAECPNCGEINRRSIDLNRSNIDIDEGEVEVYEYERETPVYKLWYFWVILLLSIVLIGGSLFIVKSKLNVEQEHGTDNVGSVSFTPPTGWTKESEDLFAGPGEGSFIKIMTCDAGFSAKVDEYADLVTELSGIEEKMEAKEVNEIDGRYIEWKTRKVVDGEEIFTNYARYVFVYKGKAYVVMYKSYDEAEKTFMQFLNSLSKGK